MSAMDNDGEGFPEAPLPAVVFCFIRLTRFERVQGFGTQELGYAGRR
jgi:hypothetical protein